MRNFLFGLLIATSAAAANASSFVIQPPGPDTHSYVTVLVGGGWQDSCVPSGTQTTISDDTITIVIHQSLTPTAMAACAPVVTPWRQTVNLGLLPPATYTVRAFVQTPNARIDLGTTHFTVRPAEPFRAFPPGAPVAGGTEVRLVSPNTWQTNQVVFGDGSPVAATQTSANVLTVTVPPHDSGTVDIKIGAETASRAFTYYDPSAPPDPSIFEPVLFPVAFTGPGAFGSSWVTDNYISAPPPEKATFFEMSDVDRLVRLDANDPTGVFLHAGRGTLGSTVLSSRIRDLSRQAQTDGTEIPIVRESDWRFGIVRLTNIPPDPNARMTLRMWADHDRPISVSVEASVHQRSNFASVEVGLTRQGNGLLYSQIDIGSLVTRVPSSDPRDLTIKYLAFDPDVRLWALVTLTNNDTQQVTAIWPQ